jgi:FkbM family methyltransferase
LEDVSGRHLYFNGTIEPAVESLFADLLAPESVVIDIGANFGLYTAIAASRLGPTGCAHAFEPDPETAERLRDTVALTQSTAAVRINELAVSNRDNEEISLWTSDGAAGKPLASLIKERSWGTFARSVNVNTITLDTYVRERKLHRIDVIKCDVEGHEWEVLSGGRETLKRHDAVVIVELAADSSHSPKEVCELMSSFGYSAEALDVPDFDGDWGAFAFGNVAFRKASTELAS